MNKSRTSDVLNRLSEYWIETEFLFFISFTAHVVFIVGFFICISSVYYNTDFDVLPKLSQIDGKMIIIALIFSIIAYITLTPLEYGIRWCYFRAAEGNAAPVSGAFFVYYELDRWIKALKLKFITNIKKLSIYIPCVAVAGVGFYLGYELVESSEGAVAGSFIRLGMIVLVYGTYVIYLVLSSRYEIVPYLFAINPNENPKRLLNKGIAYMDKSGAGYASMIISYTPFMWLCLLAFPVAVLMPIFNMAKAHAAYKIIEDYNETDLKDENLSDENDLKKESEAVVAM